MTEFFSNFDVTVYPSNFTGYTEINAIIAGTITPVSPNIFSLKFGAVLTEKSSTSSLIIIIQKKILMISQIKLPRIFLTRH